MTGRALAEDGRRRDADLSFTDLSLTDLVGRSAETLRHLSATNVGTIKSITSRMRILALNALIEAERAGSAGRGFSVVAREVRQVSAEVEGLVDGLGARLQGQVAELETATRQLVLQAQAERLVDLSLNAVELIDRNLYERTCDVRWWATDSAVVDCAASPTPEAVAHATRRLGVILSSYTVYLDLWICGLDGRILANGQPDRYRVAGHDASREAWFRRGVALASGDDYAVADIDTAPLLGGAQVATYVASIREGGEAHGRPLGVLAIHFDWEPQALAIVRGVRIDAAEAGRTRVMLIDSAHRVIAASDGRGVLQEVFPLRPQGASGTHGGQRDGIVAYHLTPGYETYRGLGWYGVIEQRVV